MSKLTADMPCPKCELAYGVMPQTYMLTRGGLAGRKSSFRPVSVLTTLIGGSCMVALSCCVRAQANGGGAARRGRGSAPSDRCSAGCSWRPVYCSTRERGDPLAATDEPDPLVCRRLDRDVLGRQPERGGDALAHQRRVRADPRPLGDDREVDVAGGVAPLGQQGDDPPQQVEAVGAAPATLGRGKVLADVAERGRAEQGVDQRVQGDVGVRVAVQTELALDRDAAEDEPPAGDQAVDVVANPDPHRSARRSASATIRSSGAVILMLRREPGGTWTGRPSRPISAPPPV